MSKSLRKNESSDYPEYAVRAEVIGRFFSPPLASSTFHDFVNKGMMRVLMKAKQIAKQIEAEWAREKQITAQFGLTHTILYNLRKEGKIRSASTRTEGKKYGARLFNVASKRLYLADQESA